MQLVFVRDLLLSDGEATKDGEQTCRRPTMVPEIRHEAGPRRRREVGGDTVEYDCFFWGHMDTMG
jgi:hypothetical protein